MAARRPRAPKPPRPKAAPARKGGGKAHGTHGRVGAPAPRKAPIHSRKVTHAVPRSPRHDPSGGHMPEEMVGGFKCAHCHWPGWREHRVVTKEGAHHATLAFAGCTNCGTLHPIHVGAAAHAIHVNHRSKVRKMADLTPAELLDVRKDVDTTESAVQRRDDGGDVVGHRKACPRGGNAPCGKEIGGVCSVCKVEVRDHEAVGKSIDAVVLDVRKLAGL